MIVLSLVVGLVLQIQAPAKPVEKTPVVVGMKDRQKMLLDNAQFTGFIESRDTGDVLLYRQRDFHGELKLSEIDRIDLNYRRGRPYDLDITLKDGHKLKVQSDKRDFLMIRGATDTGSVTIKNPDPIAPPVRLSTSAPNRKHDLTIQYLEFPR